MINVYKTTTKKNKKKQEGGRRRTHKKISPEIKIWVWE
jgi:hypothetical protein